MIVYLIRYDTGLVEFVLLLDGSGRV